MAIYVDDHGPESLLYNVLWRKKLGLENSIILPMPDDKYVIISREDGNTVMLDNGGDNRELFSLGRHISQAAKPKHGNNLLYICDNEIMAHNLDGDKLWTNKAGKGINDIAVTSSRDNVILASNDKYLYFIDSAGNIIQKHRSSKPFSAASTPKTGSFVTACSDVSLFLLTEDGEVKWTYKLKWPVSMLRISPSSKYIVTAALSNLYCFDQQQRIKWKTQLGSIPEDIIISRNDKLAFISTREGNLYALNIENGMKIWKQSFEGEIKKLRTSGEANYLVLSIEKEEGEGIVLLDYAGHKIWESNEFSIDDLNISDDGRYIILITPQGETVAIENLHTYFYLARKIQNRIIEMDGLGLDLRAMKEGIKETMERFKSKRYEAAREGIIDIEGRFTGIEKDEILKVIPRLQSEIKELKDNIGDMKNNVPEWMKLKKVFEAAIDKMEKKKYHPALKLAYKARDYINDINDKTNSIVKEKRVKEAESLLEGIESTMERLPEHKTDDDIGTELHAIKNLLKGGNVEEALERLHEMGKKVSEREADYLREEVRNLVQKMENMVEEYEGQGMEAFDARGLLGHAKKALEEGKNEAVREYAAEIERILEERKRSSSPEFTKLNDEIIELEDRLKSMEESEGVILDSVRKLINDAKELSTTDVKKASNLISRASNETERIMLKTNEMRGILEALEKRCRALPDTDQDMKILSKIEEGKFGLASGDLRRSRALITKIEEELEELEKRLKERGKKKAEEEAGEAKENGSGEVNDRDTGDDNMIKCPQCGALMPKNFEFCGKCGEELS